MATLNLGRIKPVFRGAYNNSTAYVVDDIVTSGGSSYICIQASTGNAVSNATYWTQMAAGGTDVGTTLTTQGDILYRDGSGLQRLGAGTSGQVLQTNGTGANPSWGTISSDFVKLATTTISSTVASISFDNFISATYRGYKIIYSGVKGNAHNDIFRIRFKSGGSTQTASNYKLIQVRGYQGTGSTRGIDNDNYSAWNDSGLSIGHYVGASSTRGGFGFMYFYPADGTISSNVTGIHSYYHSGSNASQFNSNHFSGNYEDVTASSGIEFSIVGTSNLFAGGTFVLYGMKV